MKETKGKKRARARGKKRRGNRGETDRKKRRELLRKLFQLCMIVAVKYHAVLQAHQLACTVVGMC